jgi:hypothetical protein
MRTQIPSLAALAAVALMSMGAAGYAATYHKPMPVQGATMTHKRIGCADGRTILHDHGYNWIKAVDCRGGTYAYLGHRHGSTFRVLVNAHTGKILKVRTV